MGGTPEKTAALEVVITNSRGLHARPAMQFAETANRFQSAVAVDKIAENYRVDGKSVMQMMTLAALPGTRLRIGAVGPDADVAVKELVRLVEAGFDED